VAGGAAIDGGTTRAVVLRDMRGHGFVAQFREEVTGVVSLVSAEPDRLQTCGFGGSAASRSA
jgi:hypothetical protein